MKNRTPAQIFAMLMVMPYATAQRHSDADIVFATHNIVKTAHYAIYGNYESFDPESVLLKGNDVMDLSLWLPKTVNRSFIDRLARAREKSKEGVHVHVMPCLLSMKSLARRILDAHYY